ncbi:DUF2073 domain-containing protein [Methanocalculus taiwanensis]|uniref:DUF2073 domain-containing protein n=1 Tax=Methanocalculus taiwanensis TaxID=106207 RepID=A0ABD4THU2_9EURY|nr:DUF2073 domain-containing protein [Methanocalculus taiwanensis]MCQ1538512.1 DUF2073 domain-containing protein [Methanocalculus taiwanensis]
MIQGVQIELISADRLSNLTTMEKIRTILDSVMLGNIVVLEHGLTPDEQSRLIEVTMMEIRPGGFSGIEMETYPGKEAESGGIFGRLFMGKKPRQGRMTVIGPAGQLKMLKIERDRLVAWASLSSGG